MKKFLVIATTPFFAPKGSSLRVDSVLNYLSKDKNNSIDFVTYTHGEEKVYDRVIVYRTPRWFKPHLEVGQFSFWKTILDVFIFIKVFKLILTTEYDVIHCEDFEAALIGSVFSIFFRKPKYIYNLHNRVSDNLRITGVNKLLLNVVIFIEKIVIKRFSLIILNWKQYEKDPIFNGKKKFLLYDRAELGLKKISLPSRKYVAYSGNYKVYQGVEYFLKIYARAEVSFDVVLVGNVSESVKRLIRKLKIEDRVYCVGQLDIKESNYMLKNSICCLIPKLSEEHRGLKIVHHVMLGKVSLASDIEANRELLKDQYNAVLYSSGKELARKLREIDKGMDFEKKYTKGIRQTQEYINKIWSYEYFEKNYFDYLFPNEK